MRALTLSVSVNLLFAAPLAAQAYEPVQVEPQIAGTPATMTPLQLGDDSTAQVDLGFEFTYWGQTFTSAWVSSNGFVSFGTSANLCCNGRPIEQAPRNTIYGLWTDLVSWSNPYYKRGEGSILFGWYSTNEYGTNNQYTFEIGLKNDSTIRFNYGAMPPLTYHLGTAGITGPGADDNILLFYGRDPGALAFQSGVLAWKAPATVDCAVTPMDPTCPPQMVSPVQVITATPIATIQDAYAADVQADQAETAAVTVAEPAQEITAAPAVEIVVETASITQQVADAVQAERLTPDQVAALAAPGVAAALAASSGTGAAATSAAPSETGAPIFLPQATAGSSSSAFVAAFESASPSSSATSAANTLEVLNTLSAPVPQMASEQQPTANAMAEGQSETMAAIASVPGFSAYTQVSLQDRPDFYAIRDIYRNRRLRDANFEMFRMTSMNNAKWQQMVDAQYER